MNFSICHFVSLMFSYIFYFLSKISMTVQFIKKIHNKIQTQKKKKKKQKQQQFQNEIWSMTNYNSQWLWNCHSDNHQSTHPTKTRSPKYPSYINQFQWNIITGSFLHHTKLTNKLFGDIRVICKVRKTQHQNPEFGHTQGEIKKKYISIQQGMKLRKISILVVNWVSSCLSFFLSASTAATYIFTAHNGTTTIISLEPCALAFSNWYLLKCLYFGDTTERFPGDSGWKEAQRQGEDRITLQITLINAQITRKHGHWKMNEP
jgi:hypothetical protein